MIDSLTQFLTTQGVWSWLIIMFLSICYAVFDEYNDFYMSRLKNNNNNFDPTTQFMNFQVIKVWLMLLVNIVMNLCVLLLTSYGLLAIVSGGKVMVDTLGSFEFDFAMTYALTFGIFKGIRRALTARRNFDGSTKGNMLSFKYLNLISVFTDLLPQKEEKTTKKEPSDEKSED